MSLFGTVALSEADTICLKNVILGINIPHFEILIVALFALKQSQTVRRSAWCCSSARLAINIPSSCTCRLPKPRVTTCIKFGRFEPHCRGRRASSRARTVQKAYRPPFRYAGLLYGNLIVNPYQICATKCHASRNRRSWFLLIGHQLPIGNGDPVNFPLVPTGPPIFRVSMAVIFVTASFTPS